MDEKSAQNGTARKLIKSARNFRGFLLRGLTKAKSEWTLVCLGHNMLKLHRYGDRKLIFGA